MNELFIISEIAQGYEGSEKLVELYIKAVAASGADAIKFQIFYADDLALPDYKYYTLFKSLELPFDFWAKAVKTSHDKGLKFFSDAFGIKSVKALNEIQIDGYKIHTTDINNLILLEEIAKIGKRVFLSTGGCSEKEIEKALSILKKSDVTLMYGFQAEPTLPEDNNLLRIKYLQDKFKLPVGFQDHTQGDTRLAFDIPFIAMGMGVEVIEKHFTLSRVAEIEDFISAFTAEEFKGWVEDMRKGWSCLGLDKWELTEKEKTYRAKVKRAVCSAVEIKEGEKLMEWHLALKRTDISDGISDLDLVIGKIAQKNIPPNSVLKKEYLS